MDALDIYLGDIKHTNILLNFCGFDLFSENPTNNIKAYIFLLDLICRNLCEFNSSYNNRTNFHNLIFTMMSWQFGIMVIEKSFFLKHITFYLFSVAIWAIVSLLKQKHIFESSSGDH